MIDIRLYDTRTLAGVYRDDRSMQPPTNYWLDLCFPQQINFTEEYIDLGKLASTRKLAPLVVPTAQGKPIYSSAERLTRIKPAYLKPKDPVTASRMIQRMAGLGDLLPDVAQSPAQRFNLLVADIIKQHRYAIERWWEWQASQSILNAQVLLEDDGYPRQLVQFDRAAGHTITLAPGARWGDAGVSVLDSVHSFREITRKALFGGVSNRLTVGAKAWGAMSKSQEIRDLLKTDYRPQTTNGLDLNIGLRNGAEVEFVGNLNGLLPVYVYSDYYQSADGTVVPMMDERDIVLTGNSVQGIRCFGAIQDKAAGWQALPVFGKMFDQDDPSATFIMHQSAPLMVPVNPNATLRARVVA